MSSFKSDNVNDHRAAAIDLQAEKAARPAAPCASYCYATTGDIIRLTIPSLHLACLGAVREHRVFRTSIVSCKAPVVRSRHQQCNRPSRRNAVKVNRAQRIQRP